MEVEVSPDLIEFKIRELKRMCQIEMGNTESMKEKALLEATYEVVCGLERAFRTSFHDEEEELNEVLKSSDPWD